MSGRADEVRAPAGPVRGAGGPTGRAAGARIDAIGLGKSFRGKVRVLDDVTFSVRPGEIVAIVGGSGAGKTTLLEALAGVRPADEGRVLVDGVDAYAHLDAFRSSLGFVPQDDIVHEELPLAASLRYVAALRLPPGTTPREVSAAVADALAALGLSARADVPVRALSGGQRKRASIASELMTRPRVFFLDEPTSGLDPATGAELMRVLRELADAGSTVVLTTHAVQDLDLCDRIVFLAEGGRLAFVGTLAETRDYFGATTTEAIYERVARDADPDEWAERHRRRRAPEAAGEAVEHLPPERRPLPGPVRQWLVLTRRAAETMARNRLTLAILLGSPALVVAMFAVLFRPGAFDFDDPSPSATIMILFWIAFGSFFFGLTYGLLQICTELPILRRERLVGLSLGAYVLSKVAVLLPFLLLVDVLMLAVLRALDRLPAAGIDTYLSLGVTLLLSALAALALGLLASALVSTPAQATLALPMLCFPAVLFSGAILPVPVMAEAGQAISLLMSDRWAFEAVGVELELRRLFAEGGSPLGPPLLQQYGDTGTWSVGTYWAILCAFTAILTAATWAALVRRCRTASR